MQVYTGLDVSLKTTHICCEIAAALAWMQDAACEFFEAGHESRGAERTAAGFSRITVTRPSLPNCAHASERLPQAAQGTDR